MAITPRVRIMLRYSDTKHFFASGVEARASALLAGQSRCMKRLYLYLFSFSLASFYFGSFGLPVAYVHLRFAITPVLLFFTILRAHRMRSALPPSIYAGLWAFVGFALMTTFWSENFQLSLIKLTIFALVVFTFAFGGSLLPELYPELNPFVALVPIFLMAVLSSVASLGLGTGFLQGNFQGSVGNANMLAATLLFTCPWILVQLYRRWTEWRLRYVLIAVSVVALALMVLSRSRTMMASTVLTLTVVFAYLRPGRKVISAYLLGVAVLLTFTFKPDLFGELKQTYVLKNRENLLESRGEQFRDSYDAAKEAGFWGGGFGVSVGMSRFWDTSTTFSDYSREKGNSFLAIWEETGIPGVALYLALSMIVIMSIVRFGRGEKDDAELRFYKQLFLAYVLGTLLSSVFEAWVLSPSPLTATFWATIGMGFGALRRASNKQLATPRQEGVFVAQGYTLPSGR